MKNKIDKSTVAILFLCFLSYAQNATASIIQTITNEFQVTQAMGRLIGTLPALTTVMTALLSGFIAGKKIKYRTMYALTCIFWGVGGMMPIFLHTSFTQILISRLIFGLGTGFGMSTGMYFVNAYDSSRQAKMVGLGTAVANIGSLVFLILGGALGELNWVYPFWMYAASFVSVILILLFLREPETEEAAEKTEEETGRFVFTPGLALFPLTALLIGLLFGAFSSGISTIVASRGLGASLVSSIILSVQTAGGIVTGTFMQKIHTKLGRFAIPVMMLVTGTGFFALVYGRSVIVLCIGGFLQGIGYFAIKPLFTLYIRSEIRGTAAQVSTMLLFTMTNLGMFLTNSWITLANRIVPFFETDLERAIFAGAVIHFIAAVIYFIWNPMKMIEPKHTPERASVAGEAVPVQGSGR